MKDNLKHWLSTKNLQNNKTDSGFPDFVKEEYLTGDNKKYLKMYGWLSSLYDLIEKTAEKFWSRDRIAQMRRQLMEKLEWSDGISVLCVSIGTGRDLDFIPQHIDLKSLNICGADISAEMMKRCRKKWSKKLNLTLVRCCAEDLPFKDEAFDIVFHFGGINFFNDKEAAVKEMLRVAKKGSKLLIADETEDLIEGGYNKISFSRRYFKDKHVSVEAIENHIPADVSEKETDLLWENRIYCITFRKN